MSWKEVARAFRTSWQTVFRAVEMAVEWGQAHRDLDGVESIGIDELHWSHGQKYLTLVYQIDGGCRRLLWIGRARTKKTIRGFYEWFGERRCAALRFICSDMWRPFLDVSATMASGALHVLDRYHIVAHMNKAIDTIRRQEVKALRAKGMPAILKNSRWILLRRRRTCKQQRRLRELASHNLKAVRACLYREEFQHFWTYRSVTHAARFLNRWSRSVMRSRLEPMKDVVRMLRRHYDLILNWVRAKGAISNGIVEGLNNKSRVVTRRAYGFRGYRTLEVALYHTLGNLPQSELAHRFW